VQRNKTPLAALVLALCLAGPATIASAQSQNSQALALFKTGNEERDLQRKIAAYERAIKLDTTFAEAYYNLGMAYKQLQDPARVEQYFRKAYAFKANRFTAEQKNRLYYELALALKKQRKASEAESMLREAKTAIADKKLKSMAAFELGKLLFEQERLPEALKELRDGQRIKPSNQAYFTNLIQIAENSLAVQTQYDKALQAETSGQWQEARALFAEIKDLTPEYKDAAVHVAKLDSILKAENTNAQTLLATFEQAQQYEQAGNLELAVSVYEHLLQQKGERADLRARFEQAREKLEQKRRTERADSEYAVGLAALKAQNWTGAILAFERVQEIDPSYSTVRDKINEAQSNLQRESNDNICARYYADGLTAMERSDWGGALAAFEKVRRIDSGYREVNSMLARMERALEVPRQIAADTKTAAATRVQNLHEEALVAMAKEDWMKAVISLETIQLLQPNYRDAVERLGQARAQLNAGGSASLADADAGPSSANLAVMLTAAIILLLLGFLVLSPAMRARYYLLRGDHAAVARIYERMLAKNPQRAKLNHVILTTLSNYYLMSGRADDHALEVYKTAQQSNLLASKSEELETVLKQHASPANGQSTEALKVLESALHNRKIPPYTSK